MVTATTFSTLKMLFAASCVSGTAPSAPFSEVTVSIESANYQPELVSI